MNAQTAGRCGCSGRFCARVAVCVEGDTMTYWYHDGDDRHECETEEEAKSRAQRALDDEADHCHRCGEWGEAVEFVSWGRVIDGKDVAIERATRVNVLEMCREPRGCACGKLHGGDDYDDADEGYSSDVDYLCDYELRAVEVTT